MGIHLPSVKLIVQTDICSNMRQITSSRLLPSSPNLRGSSVLSDTAFGRSDLQRSNLFSTSLNNRASDPGGTIQTAQDLGTIDGRVRLRGTVGRRDVDIFRFALASFTDVSALIRNRSNFQIIGEVLNAQGTPIPGLSRTLGPRSRQTITGEDAPPGVYFLKLTSSRGRRNEYLLNIRTT
jgi:hypothetical protein